MTRTTVVVDRLSRRYGSVQSVADVSFTCEPESVTAFLGPNGSGKSTTLRMMLGLTPPDHGSTHFNGHSFSDLVPAGIHVGALLDASAHHRGRSVLETVVLACLLTGKSKNRAFDCLQLTGLTSVARRRVGTLSLGMRQRLGLALAVVGEPPVLILDEPSNGLDPEGIDWMTSLLREHADRGGTVLLSSHHLNDVEAVADHVVIIDKGRIVEDQSHISYESRSTQFTARDTSRFVAAFQKKGIASSREPCGRITVDAEPIVIWQVSRDLDEPLLSLTESSQGSLRSRFLTLTTGEFTGGSLAGQAKA